jgi:hypothetical protein
MTDHHHAPNPKNVTQPPQVDLENPIKKGDSIRYIQRHTVSFLPPTQFLRIEHNIESPYDFGLSEFFIFLGILILCYIILIALIFGTIYAFFTLFH